MSTIIKQSDIGAYSDPRIEALIKQFGEGTLQQEAKQMGPQDGFSNSPPLHGAKLAPCIQPLTAGFDSLLMEIHALNDTNALIKLGSVDRERSLEEQTALKKEINERKNQKKQVIAEMPGLLWFWVVSALIAACIISILCLIGEWISFVNAAQTIAPNFFFAALIATSATIAIGLITHFAPRQIANSRFGIIRRLGNMLVILSVALALLALAYIRQDYLIQLRNEHVSVYAFFIPSLILFLGFFYALNKLLLPTWKSYQSTHKEHRAKRAAKKETAYIAMLDARLKASDEGLHERLLLRTQKLYYAKHCEARIQALYKKAVSAYIAENVKSRMDKGIPDAFQDAIPPLTTLMDTFEIN